MQGAQSHRSRLGCLGRRDEAGVEREISYEESVRLDDESFGDFRARRRSCLILLGSSHACSEFCWRSSVSRRFRSSWTVQRN